jgi:hypothetical protein
MMSFDTNFKGVLWVEGGMIDLGFMEDHLVSILPGLN